MKLLSELGDCLYFLVGRLFKIRCYDCGYYPGERTQDIYKVKK